MYCITWAYFITWTYLGALSIVRTRNDFIVRTYFKTRAFCGMSLIVHTRNNLIVRAYWMIHAKVILEDVAFLTLKPQTVELILKVR